MRNASLALALMASALFAGSVQATPPAGTVIGNQASATYSDDSAVTRTVTSNTVTTVVQQVASFTLTADSAKTSNAGGQVAYPHTLTNTGNGTDTFALTVPGNTGTFTFSSVTLYADSNGDGVADNTTPITSTGELQAGGVFKFVMVGVVPNTAVAGNTNTTTVTAASGFTPATTASNTDTTTITTQGVISVTQALDVTYGPSPAGPRTITLTYTNTGNTTATNVTLADLIPSGMTYVAGSARWSGTGATVLTDADNSDNQSGIVYDFGVTTSNRITAVIASVGPGLTGTLTFQVNVNSGVAPGANPATALTATYAYNNGATNIAATNTNTVQYIVAQTAALTVSSATVASAVQGATVPFTNTVTNNGNGTDTFNITLNSSTFPAGTTLQLFRADGVTPLTDSNGDGIPDTGPIAAGASIDVVVVATLPSSVNGGGAYTVQVVGTSVFDTSKQASGTDTLTTISTNSVDLTNSNGSGAGAGPEVASTLTNTVAPGGTTRFPLVITNTSTVADNYNLAVSTDSSFAALNLPAGWSVVFHDAADAVIANTGVIAAGGTRTIYADVTAPASATTGFDIYFRALSPSSGAGDVLHDTVAVGTVRSLVLTPNNTAQAVSGSTVVFVHSLVNTGTATEGSGASTVSLGATSSIGFTSVVYWDKNNDGVLDANDPIVTSLADLSGGANGASTAAGLDPAERATLFVKVTTLSGQANGVTDTTTLTATITGTIGGVAAPSAVSATDTTVIITSNLTLEKKQALDADCDGTADDPLSSAAIGAGAVPGACIRYEITASNVGSANVLTLHINDATPPSTTYHGTVAAATTVGTVTAPANGATGSVIADVGTLTPGQSAVLTFGVRIQP